jgi:uncharacterized protein YbaP (TraB family)
MSAARALWCGAACALALVACAPRADAPTANPALWTFSDADTTVTMFGTVHAMNPKAAWRSPAFDAALAKADVIYLEADTGGDAIARAVQENGFLPAGEGLSDALTPDQAARLERVVKGLKLPRADIERARPWLAGLQIALAFMIKTEGVDPEYGVETVIEAHAKKAGVTLAFFETAEQQMLMLAMLPQETQVASLLATLRQIEEEPESAKDLFDLWVAGKPQELGALAKRQFDEAPGLYGPLIVLRNQAWVEQIDAIMQTHSGEVLIAVGAAHLAGPDSVQTLLEAKGYDVLGPAWSQP